MNQDVDIGAPMKQSTKSCESELQTGLHEIVDAIESGVCGLDTQGNATFCNDALLKMTGYRTEEVVGRNLHELLHHSHPDGSRYPVEECKFHKGIDTSQVVHITGEYLWRKDGSCFPADYWACPLTRPS